MVDSQLAEPRAVSATPNKYKGASVADLDGAIRQRIEISPTGRMKGAASENLVPTPTKQASAPQAKKDSERSA